MLYEKLTASAVGETTPLPMPMCRTPYGRFAPVDVLFTEPLEPLDVRIINSSDFCSKSLTPWLSLSSFQVNQSPCHFFFSSHLFSAGSRGGLLYWAVSRQRNDCFTGQSPGNDLPFMTTIIYFFAKLGGLLWRTAAKRVVVKYF